MTKKQKIAAIADIHVTEHSAGQYNELFEEIGKTADILVICGDFTAWGLVKETNILLKELYTCNIPIIVTLGNHEYESGQQQEIIEVLQNNKITVLNGESIVINGIGFAGTKGFCGGFGNHMMPSWGEVIQKEFVRTTIDEAVKLENSLNKLETKQKIVLLHYSPIKETISNESSEIYMAMGSSRLVEPINRLGATVVFHGHAHLGPHEGKTDTGIPVFNVSMDVMKKIDPQKPYLIFEV